MRKRSKTIGRRGLIRLEGMDLRTKDGRSFRKHFKRLRETYPTAAEHELKTLASLQVQIEIAQRDTFGDATYWERARSRTSLLELVKLSRRMERELEAAKPPAEPSKPPSLADYLAARAKGAADD
jgi:hypothetical protein